MVPAALNFRPRLVLISAGFDAHRLDPTEGCMLETDDLAQMACPSATSPRVSEHRPAPVLRGGTIAARWRTAVSPTLKALGGAARQSRSRQIRF